jgi:nucleoside-diphosphate-sugar epimerase
VSSRRSFLSSSLAIGSAAALRPLIGRALHASPVRARAPLSILILGGTGFTGPEQVEYAIARGHRVTLFNRNKTRPGLFGGRVHEELVGDLNSDTSALAGKRFDVVIDNPTTFPAWVRNGARALAGNVGHYIVGPHDRTDRFTWWPARIAEGGEVLAPDHPDDPCQFIDSRDLAEWTVRMAERQLGGTFNAVGPDKPMTVSQLLYGVRAVTSARAQFTWVPWSFLQSQSVRPWRLMTVWQPPVGTTAGYQRRKTEKAIANGLTFRPVAVTASDTLAWHRARSAAEQAATLRGEINGIGMAREAEVLAAWKARLGTKP